MGVQFDPSIGLTAHFELHKIKSYLVYRQQRWMFNSFDGFEPKHCVKGNLCGFTGAIAFKCLCLVYTLLYNFA